MAGRWAGLLLGCLIKQCVSQCVVASGWPSSPLADGESCEEWKGNFDEVQHNGVDIGDQTDCDNVCASGGCLSTGVVQTNAPVCGSFMNLGNGCVSNADCGWDANSAAGLACTIPSTCKSGQCVLGGSSACSMFERTVDGGNSVCASGVCLGGATVMGQPRCETNAGWPTEHDCDAPPTSAPTSAPTPASVSGDPILKINGHTVKFDLPIARRTLFWKDNTTSVFAKADVFTPDKQNQWLGVFRQDFFVEGIDETPWANTVA